MLIMLLLCIVMLTNTVDAYDQSIMNAQHITITVDAPMPALPVQIARRYSRCCKITTISAASLFIAGAIFSAIAVTNPKSPIAFPLAMLGGLSAGCGMLAIIIYAVNYD